MTEKIRPPKVVLVGGYPLYRQALTEVLNTLGARMIVQELETAAEIQGRGRSPDIVLFLSRSECLRFLGTLTGCELPPPRMLLFSPYGESALASSTFNDYSIPVLPLAISVQDAGKYLGRLISGADINVIRSAIQRDVVLQRLFLPSISELTPREKRVLRYMSDGLNNGEIAEKMYIRKNTVKVFIGRIYKKVGALSRTQAVCAFISFLYANC